MSVLKKRASFFLFFRQVRQEVARVTWPGRQEVVLTSFFVLLMVFLFATFFLIVDNALASLVHFVLGWGQ